MAVVGIVHPGEMGASVAGALTAVGTRVVWTSENRSNATRRRADEAGLDDVGTLEQLVATAGVIICVCPPDAALDVARSVAAAAFSGIYVDANAVSPGTARTIGAIAKGGGARFVDADLIGGPARPGGQTRLYLSGPDGAEVARLFQGSDRLEAIDLGRDIAAASALKMCYAAWTKGSAALLLVVRALATNAGVDEALLAEWRRSQPDAVSRSEAARGTGPKAWRFAGEMDEIALAISDARLPGAAMPAGAEQVYRSLAGFKGTDPSLPDLLEAMATWREARKADARKADVMAKLAARHTDAWVATSSPDGQAHLVPLSIAWDGRRVVLATPPASPTAVNIRASGKARIALGATRDVVLIDAVLDETVDLDQASAELAELYATQADWDPRHADGAIEYLLLYPDRIQAWRQANEIEGRTVMRDGAWLV